MTKAEKELEQYKELFSKLRPVIILAISEYYTGNDRDKIKSKYEELAKDLP